MTALNPYGDTLTAQPSGVADCHIVQTPAYTVAGSQVASGQPNMMIVYRNNIQDLMPITAENLCKLSLVPINVECPHCRRTAVTEVEKVPGGYAMFMACALGLTLCIGLCVLYSMWDELQDRIHHCGSCKRVIAEKDSNLNATLMPEGCKPHHSLDA